MRTQNILALWAGSVCLLASSSQACADGGSDPWDPATFSNRIEWPFFNPPQNPVSFSGTIVGNFSEESIGCAIVVEDGTPYYLWSPDEHAALSTLPGSLVVTDIALYPAMPGALRTLDRAIACTATGLVLIEYSPELEVFELTPIGDSQWANARRVIVRQMDGLGWLDLVGISADGLSGLLLTNDGTTFASTSTSFPLSAEAQGVVAIDYTSATNPELFFLNAGGLDIHRKSGALLGHIPAAFSGGGIERLDYEAGGVVLAERMAWITHPASGVGWELRVFDSSVQDTPLALDISPDGELEPVAIEFGSMTALDINGDGYDDLAIAQLSSQTIPILLNQLNQTAGPHFQLSSTPGSETYMSIVYGSAFLPAPSQQGRFGAGRTADTEGESLIAPLDEVGQVLVVRLPGEFETEMGSVLPPGVDMSVQGDLFPDLNIVSTASYDIPSVITTAQSGETTQASASLKLYFNDFPWLTAVPKYDHLQVVVWTQGDPETEVNGPFNVDDIAQSNYLYPFPDQSHQMPREFVVVEIPDHAEECMGWADRRHRYLEIRFVDVDESTNKIVKRSSSILLGLAMDRSVGTSCVAYGSVELALPYFLYDFSPLPLAEEQVVDLLPDYSPPIPPGSGGTSLTGQMILIDYVPPMDFGTKPRLPVPDIKLGEWWFDQW